MALILPYHKQSVAIRQYNIKQYYITQTRLPLSVFLASYQLIFFNVKKRCFGQLG